MEHVQTDHTELSGSFGELKKCLSFDATQSGAQRMLAADCFDIDRSGDDTASEICAGHNACIWLVTLTAEEAVKLLQYVRRTFSVTDNQVEAKCRADIPAHMETRLDDEVLCACSMEIDTHFGSRCSLPAGGFTHSGDAPSSGLCRVSRLWREMSPDGVSCANDRTSACGIPGFPLRRKLASSRVWECS